LSDSFASGVKLVLALSPILEADIALRHAASQMACPVNHTPLNSADSSTARTPSASSADAAETSLSRVSEETVHICNFKAKYYFIYSFSTNTWLLLAEALYSSVYTREDHVERDDPALIQIIRSVGFEKPGGGPFTKLKIIEIPDDVPEWEVV
jgi:hypothetical protein